jgi:hypothetical protein
MSVLRSSSTLPTAAHTRTLLSGTKYAEDCSGDGSYLRITAEAPSAAIVNHVRVRNSSTLTSAAHTRTLLSGTKYAEDCSGDGSYLQVWWSIDVVVANGTFTAHADADCTWSGFAVPIGRFTSDADAECSWTATPAAIEWNADADAGTIFYGRANAFWTCDSEAGGDTTGHATEWHVSGLRMDADAGASFEGHPTGVGSLIMDADAGMQIWPRLRAIPESCLGAHTDAPGEAAGELSNYVY